MRTVKTDVTKRGFPAMWESGGGLTSRGSAIIITGKQGEARRPVYVPRGGHLAGGKHALIVVHEGYHLVYAGVARGDRSRAVIEKITSISVKDIDGEEWDSSVELEKINTFSCGEWERPLDEKFIPAIEAAFNKAGVYHCRSCFYVDMSQKKDISEEEKKRRDDAMRRQDAERARLRQQKAEREAQAKKEAEEKSKAAKDAGLGARLEAVNARLEKLGHKVIELGDIYFKCIWHWESQLYTESRVINIEQRVTQLENEEKEQKRKRLVREEFQPKFETLKPRIEALGLTLEFTDADVRLSGDFEGKSYSDEGLTEFMVELDRREREAVEAKAKADAEAVYQERKTKAMRLGLPSNIRIWRRRGGRTNAGDGWVIGPDGQDRDNTAWYNPRSRYPREGDKIWEQILEGEVVLKWAKSSSASPHKFQIIHLPEDHLTEAQLERIREIQDELEAEWKDARGLASGAPSPSVGDGWSLC